MKKLSTLLIIVGILLISVPLIGGFYIKYKQDALYDEMLSNIEKSTDNDTSNDNADYDIENDEYPAVDIMDENFSEAITQIEETESKKEEKKQTNLKAIGRVEITRLGIDLIILEGSSQYVLMHGAGHMEKTAYPGEIGNFVLAGHRGYAYATFFYRLHKVKIGDIVKITYGDKVYEYTVTDSFLVLPTDLSVLKQPKDKKELTLITCDPPIEGTHRIIIKAQIIEDEDTESTDDTDKAE